MFTTIGTYMGGKKVRIKEFSIAPNRCKVVQQLGLDHDCKKSKRDKTDEANDRIKSFGEFPARIVPDVGEVGASEKGVSGMGGERGC